MIPGGVFLFVVLLVFGVAAAGLEQRQQQQRWMDSRGRRAGDVTGLEDGRITLAKVSVMLTSSVHVELAGSEDAFRRALDHEWDNLSARPAGTRGPFLVCSAPGRANAKRLRELAGADSLVETLHHRKGEILCSFASLDVDTAALVAADGVDDDTEEDGGGGGRGQGTFSVEPLPHFAKLAPMVAADPSPAALLLSSEAATEGGGERDDAGTESGEEDSEAARGERGGRRLRTGAGGDKKIAEKGKLSVEQRSRVLAAATAAADRPRTRRLIQDGESGILDAIEIILVNHHERRSKSETEELVERWLSLARDQSALADFLRAEHFWGQQRGLSQHEDEEEEKRTDVVDNIGDQGSGRRRLLAQEADNLPSAAEEQQKEMAEERAQELAAHEERKRLGWAHLLDVVDRGQGSAAGSGGEREETVAAGSCRFDQARFTVSPSGKKVLLHRPNEMVAAAAAGNGSGGRDDNGCLSALLAYVSLQPEVRYVTARRKTVSMNLAAAGVSQSGVDGYTPLWDENLQGQDEIIGVADTGVDMNHCQFREDDGDNVEASDWDNPITDLKKRKVVQYIKFVDDFDAEGGHGTHVAGTIAGARSGEEAGGDEGDGIAFQGKLAVFDFADSAKANSYSTPDEVDAVILQPAYDGGARVHSNSWDALSIEYTSLSREADEFVYTHQDLLVVFSAGNCGDTDNPTNNCAILHDEDSTVLSPAQSKNVLAVGASESAGVSGKNPYTVPYFSSKGPTIDGRIKPDVVAPGDPTWSAYADPTRETCEFGTQEGTSMSAPVVAGNGAMARQYFREGWYNGAKNLTQGFEPSSALLKAVLINSATAMSFVGVSPLSSALDDALSDPPDIHQGFGRVTMVNALNINATAAVGIFFEDWLEIREGETLEYNVSLNEDADLDKDLRVTLVWTDPPASVGSTSALIHDLDLVVIAQSTGTEYYPNGGDKADSVNNVEKVVITNTTEGETYTIRVSCDELSDADSQNFAFIANGEFVKTNDLPTVQDPSDWLDLVDNPSGTIFTWEYGALLALGVVACCAMACACRRFNRDRRHRLTISKYRRKITTNRGRARGHKLHPHDSPVRHPGKLSFPGPPYHGFMHHSGELNVSGPGRFKEPWRRPGPESIGGRSMRSMRSEQSARGALLTGAGALVPGQLAEGSHEACPQCGLRLSDVVQLAKHLETRHGGRASRKRDVAAAVPEVGHVPRTAARLKVVKVTALKKNGSNSVPAAKLTTPRDGAGRRTGIPFADSPAAATARVGASPARLSRPCSVSPELGSVCRHEPRPHLPLHHQDDCGRGRGEGPRLSSSAAVGGSLTDKAAPSSLPMHVTAGADGVSDSGSPSPRETRKRSADTGIPPSTESYGGEGGRGQERGREREREHEVAPGLERSGRGLVKEEPLRSLTRTSSVDRMTALSSRAIARSTSQKTEGDSAVEESAVGSAAGDGGVGDGGVGDGGAAQEDARWKLISRRRIRRSASTEDAVPSAHRLTADGLRALGSGLPENFKLPPSAFSPVKASAKEPAYSFVARERASELDKERPVSLTRKFFRQLSGDGSPRETSKCPADLEIPPPRGSYVGESGRGREREHEVAPGLERSGRGLVKEESTRNLTRTSSLDRMTALSSRAIARSTSQKTEGDSAVEESAVGSTAGGDGGAAQEDAHWKLISRRRIRRSASSEDAVPSAHRLTADGLRALGSGLPENFKLPPSAFSPVKASAKEPAYSPVARERAGELDKERPVSLTRKFFRQLSRDG